MANMTWTPDESRDKKVKQYLDKINHAPYGVIIILSMVLFCLLTTLVLFGTFYAREGLKSITSCKLGDCNLGI